MLRIENLSVIFAGKKLLEDINLTINQNQKIVILGGSGSGKSTLLKSILFFVPFSGEIFLKAKKIVSENLLEYRCQFSYVAQETLQIDDTVANFINYPFQFKNNHGLSYSISQLESLLEHFSLNKTLLEKKFNLLSGGEQQRIRLIQAILLNKPVMLFDEVTNHLDKDSKEIVIEYLMEKLRGTILIITHDPVLAERSDIIYKIGDTTLTRI